MDVCSKLPQTHLPTLAVSAVTMTLLIAAKELNGFFSSKLPVPVPVELITVSSHVEALWACTVESLLGPVLMMQHLRKLRVSGKKRLNQQRSTLDLCAIQQKTVVCR